MEKLWGGIEEYIRTVPVGVPVKQDYACGRTFVARDQISGEYLYFMDEDKKFDVVGFLFIKNWVPR